MDDLDRTLNEQLKNPNFKREWDALENEYIAIQKQIDASVQHRITNSSYGWDNSIKTYATA